MNEVNKNLLQTRGAERCFQAPIVGVRVSRNGQTLAAMTVDGKAILIPLERLRQVDEWRTENVHDGALSFIEDCSDNGFLSGGEDGRVVRLLYDGQKVELFKGRGWIDCLASTSTHYAFSCKKTVVLREASQMDDLKTLETPSSVSGLSFDTKGKRLAAAHYNGVSMWFVQSKESLVRSLTWKGSHTGLCIHPAGEALVTSMQENELHGWRLSDGHNMRMSGYPKKIASIDFTRNGRWLATSGADAAVLWPFFGGGPMGKAPMETARLPGLFTTVVKTHPKDDILAIGFEDGTVLLAEIDGKNERILPMCHGRRSGGVDRGAITSLAFTPQGGALIFGTEEGYVGVINLSSNI